MKKSKTMRAASFLLVLTLMTSCFVGSTFAKYTSTASGTATATVAKWSFEVNSTNIAQTVAQTVTFNLFDTINDTGNTATEGDVATGLIAPGTAGSFELALKNTSEVTADYEITLSHSNSSNIPLEYSVDGSSWSSDIASLKIEGANMTISTGEKTETVYWRWQYGDVASLKDDTTDTALGIAAASGTAPEVKVTVSVTAWQVD